MCASDLPHVADTYAKTFAEDEMFKSIWSYRLSDPSVYSSYRDWWLLSTKNAFYDAGANAWVACKRGRSSTEEHIVGAVFWMRRGKSATARSYQQSKQGIYYALERKLVDWESTVLHLTGSYGSAFNRELSDTFDAMAEQCKNKWGEKMPERWHLLMIGVDPQHQRKGLATRLISWGLDRARDEGVQATLLASPQGRALYERQGFFILDWPSDENVIFKEGQNSPYMVFEPPALDLHLNSVRAYAPAPDSGIALERSVTPCSGEGQK